MDMLNLRCLLDIQLEILSRLINESGVGRGQIWRNMQLTVHIWSDKTEKVKVKLLSRVRLFATPWTVAYQAPLSMGFSRQEYWEWVAISFSRRSSWPRDWSQVSRIVGRRFTVWATREVSVGILWSNIIRNRIQKKTLKLINTKWSK